MHTVAVLTQTLRISHCLAFLRQREGQYLGTILVGNTGVVASTQVPDGFQVACARGPERPLPSAVLAQTRARARILAWARSGSGAGHRVEKLARELLWKMRYLDRISIIRRITTSQSKKAGMVSSDLVEALHKLHLERSIDEIIVFDLYDLPAALAFSDESGVPVLVR